MSDFYFPCSHIRKALYLRLKLDVWVTLAPLNDGSLGIEVYDVFSRRVIGTFQKPNTRPELDILVEEIYLSWVFER